MYITLLFEKKRNVACSRSRDWITPTALHPAIITRDNYPRELICEFCINRLRGHATRHFIRGTTLWQSLRTSYSRRILGNTARSKNIFALLAQVSGDDGTRSTVLHANYREHASDCIASAPHFKAKRARARAIVVSGNTSNLYFISDVSSAAESFC